VKQLRWGLLALLATASLGVVPAAAAATYTDSVSGVEVAATSTEGTFVGQATGALPGAWQVTVDHTPLGPNAAITGGSLSLTTTLAGSPAVVVGTLTGGSVTLVSSTGCSSRQQFAIDATLGSVGTWPAGSGTGTFTGTLTHYRASIFGRCVTYSATVSGTVSLDF
jgi:hypothetical protein